MSCLSLTKFDIDDVLELNLRHGKRHGQTISAEFSGPIEEKRSKLLACCLVGVMVWLCGGCIINDWVNPKPKVTGRVVAFRDSKPIGGVSVKTYKQLYNCGFGCSNRQLVDSSGTDTDGYFSLKASEADLELSISKKGYFSLIPGDGQITKRIQAGNNDYKTIRMKPSARIVVTYVNKVGNQDSLYYEYYACGDRVNTGMGSPFQSGKKLTLSSDVEGDCTVDFLTTVYRKGTKTLLKESVYVPQSDTLRKTIEY